MKFSELENREKENKGGRHWEDLVGYSLDDLMINLETTFPEGYGWEDLNKLEIDHIIPKSHFKYASTEDEEFKKCWALNNLQFLTIEDNRKKKNKLIWFGGKESA